MKILIFGAGKWGQRLLGYFNELPGNHVIGFIDNNIQRNSINDYRLYKPSDIKEVEYDSIIIAVSSQKAVTDIRQQLLSLHIPQNKICSLFENKQLFIDVFSKTDNMYDEMTDQRVCWLRSFARYVREEKIAGNVAECGVNRGDFAAYINKYFSTQKLYLFDTFEGFPEVDLQAERNIKNEAFLSGRFNINDKFASNCEEIARMKMHNLQKVEFHKGYFPETAIGINDKFCFVNLDMDLYQPMLAGLEFFYPQMSTGGVLLLHDYFHHDLPGVKKAVNDYEERHTMHLVKMPIGDDCSIAIIKNDFVTLMK